MPICLGQGISVGPIYDPTRLNPADGPSRLQEVAPPLWDLPEFAADGDVELLERWQRYPRQRRAHAPWARLVLHLLVFGSAARRRACGESLRAGPGEDGGEERGED